MSNTAGMGCIALGRVRIEEETRGHTHITRIFHHAFTKLNYPCVHRPHIHVLIVFYMYIYLLGKRCYPEDADFLI